MRRKIFFWNHDDCSFEICPLVAEEHGRCYSCTHRQGDNCGLTRSPLPAWGGCCHWNVEVVEDPQPVTPAMLEPLGVTAAEPVAAVLASLDAPYTLDDQGQIWVDPADLGLSETYGIGTETVDVEELDWSAWALTWREE
jgi:dihydropteroate synthase